MLRKILTPAYEAALRDERRILGDLRAALAAFGAPEDAQQALARSIGQLDELFLLVVVGEFNAGKSAFINALVGRHGLPEGVTPTTAQVTILRYGDRDETTVVESNLIVVTAPVDLLREIHLVDTPGTNAILREHERVTAGFVPRSDLVLFVTSADRPFTESERAFLQQIRDWGKKIVFVVNKIDILERPEEVQEVVRFVADSSLKLLGVSTEVFPVSARQALRAKLGEPALLEPSRFEALERYIRSTLDEASRLRLKLLNPVGVARQITGNTLAVIDERRAVIRDDVAMLDDVERQLVVYEQDMTRDFRLRMAEIEKILVEMESRGHDYFDEMLRIGRVFDLVNTARVQAGFEQQVVADAPQQIERKVGGLIDWLVDADFRQWQAVTGHLAERRRAYRERIVGDREESGFHYDRTRLIDSVGREAQRVVDGYDRAREARAMADGARTAVATAAAMGAGALGLGTLVSLVASTAAADITGLVAASAMAVIGFFILPARRRAAKQEMRKKVTALREGLAGALQRQFAGELQRSIERLRASIAPYTRFVRAEGARLDEHAAAFHRLHDELARLATRIEAL